MRSTLSRATVAAATGLAAVATAVLPAAPAQANTCPGPLCLKKIIEWLPDITGEVLGLTCGGAFTYEGDEGSLHYWSGPITGATAFHSDPATRHMSITCSIRDRDSLESGTQRGATTANSVAPLNNVVSAAGLDLEFSTTTLDQTVYLCTEVAWTDKFGLPHAEAYDADPNTAGHQCPALIDIPSI
jgi:hypothetical protein